MIEMQKEIDTLEKLYNQYNIVCHEIEVWNTHTFVELQKEPVQIGVMRDFVVKYTGESKKLGKDLKK